MEFKGINNRYNYFYKITNNINKKYYYGVHSTKNLDDGYMGSGTRLKCAFNKYGIENFSKEILKFFDNVNEMYEYEKLIVNNDIITDDNCYNIKLGGKQFDLTGLVKVIDENNKITYIPKTDIRWINKILKSPYKNKTIVKNINNEKDIKFVDCNNIPENYVGIQKNKVTVIDENGKIFSTDVTNINYINKKYKHITTGRVTIKNNDGTYSSITKEEFYNNSYKGMFKDTVVITDEHGINKRVSIYDDKYISGEYKSHNIGKTMFKDKDGNSIYCSVTDERVLNGELVGATKGYKTSEKTKKLLSEKFKGRKWINNGTYQKLVNKNELNVYLNNGWVEGILNCLTHHTKETCKKISKSHKELVAITNGTINKQVHYSMVEEYIKQGWRKGVTRFNKKKIGIKIWINNGIKQTYINKNELEEYLNNGWNLGMIKRK